MHLAIAIVGFRNPEDVMRCLAAVERSTYQDFEIVICENGGNASFADLTGVLPAVLAGGQPVRAISRPDNPGFAGGVNACIGASPDADAWWVLNPDTVPSPNAMAGLMDRLRLGDCHAVGSTLRLRDGRVQSHGGFWNRWLGRSKSIGWGSLSKTSPGRDEIESRQNYLNGASMLIGRKFLEITGTMCEDYFLYCEEVDWCIHGLSSGMRLGFAPDAEVLHYQGTTMGSSEHRGERSRLSIHLGERNKILLTRKYFPACLPIVIFSLILLISYRFASRGGWRRFLYEILGLWAGIMGESGKPSWMRGAGNATQQ
jgi:N-acetylglucosaminyl-diphospho-decaprenol L-rhamnosyltransferase